jgi:hypothetical protein
MYKLNAKHTGRQWDLADEGHFDVLEDCTYCGRSRKLAGLDRVDSNLHYMPAERGVMLHNLQLYQAESGHGHLPAALSPHSPSEHRC